MSYEIDTERVFSPFAGSGYGHEYEYGYASNYTLPALSHAPVTEALRLPPVPQTTIMRIPPGYKLVPMGNSEKNESGASKKKILLIAGLVIVAGIVIYMMMKNSKRKASASPKTPSQAIKKLPTARLARNLYQRLARNGTATDSMLAELEQLSKE